MTASARWRFIAAVLLVVAVAAIAILVVNGRLTRQAQTELYVPKKAKLTPEILLLQEYVRIDTSNPPGNEIAGAKFLGAQLDRAGVRYEIIESAPRRANLYARIKGKQPGNGLLLLNHIDVVPAPPKGWYVPPFSGAIRINMLHGRGAVDMKSIALCELEAFLDLARGGRVPERDVVFLATADEEAGSAQGVRWLLDHRPDVFDGIHYVLTEGGVTEMQQEKVTYFGIEIGSKQIVEVDLVAASEEPLRQARLALEPYFHPRDPDRVLEGVRHFFRAVAPVRLDYRETLTDVDATIAAGKFWLLPDTMRDLLQNSMFISGIRRLPDGRFATKVTLSDLPDEDPDRRLQWLAQQVKRFDVALGEVTRKEGPVPLSPDQTPLFDLIARELRSELGNVPVGPEMLGRSTSDARFLRPRGMICYGLQPFPLDFFQSLTIHQINERVRLDWYMSGVRMMKRLVGDWASAPVG